MTASLGLPGSVPSSVRVLVVRPEGVHSAIEQERLKGASLEHVTVDALPGRHTARWSSTNPSVDAMLTIDHDLSSDDMACAHFTGPDRVLLATQLVSVLNFVPVEVMHLIARGPADASVRRHALGLLAQFYVAADGESHWDGDIDDTVEGALHDVDSGVRLEALTVVLQGNPAAAVDHLRHEALRVHDVDDRALLTSFLPLAQRASIEFPVLETTPPGSLWLRRDRLAVPVFSVGPMSNVVNRLAGVADLVGEPDDSRFTEFRACGGLTADVVFFYEPSSRIGCSYFSGPDGVALAAGIAWAVQYFPIHLAVFSAAAGRVAAVTELGIRALQLTVSPPFDRRSVADGEPGGGDGQ